MPSTLDMPLEERDEALASVEALLSDARAGRGRVLVVEGPPGIGKTRLLGAVHERANAAGMRTLSARAGELERDFPYGIVRQLFETALAGPRRDELLRGAAHLVRPLFDIADAGDLDAADPTQGTLHGLYWLTVNAAEAGPLVVSVDDLHWSDPASLRYLAHLVRRLDGLGVLVLATMRPRSSQEPGVIDEITDGADAAVLRLAPLSGEGVSALLAARFGTDPDPQFSSTVTEWTAGNPLLLRELMAAAVVRRIEPTPAGARQIRELTPQGVGRLVLGRIAPLGPHSLAVAEATAILSEDAGIDRVAGLAGLLRADAMRSVHALRGVDVLSHEELPAFAHPLVRRAIYDQMDVGRREALHASAAEMLAAAGAAPARVATHLLNVGPCGDDATVAWLRSAARDAMAQGAPDAAATFLTRALAEPPLDADRPTVTLELGLALAQSRPADSVPHLTEVIETIDDDQLLAEAVLALSYTPLDSYAEWARIALGAVDRISDARAARRIEAHYGAFGLARPEHYPSVNQLLDSVSLVDGDGADPESRIMLGLKAYHAARKGRQPELAHQLARAALTGDVLIASDSTTFGVPCHVLIDLDRFDEALAALDTALARARRTAFEPMFVIASWLRAWALLGRGDLAGAEAEIPIELDTDPQRIAGYRIGPDVLGQIALYRGDVVSAAEHLEYPDELEEPGVWGWALNRGQRGVLRALQGRLDDALADLLASGEWLNALGCANPAYFPWRSEAALVLSRLDRREDALALAHEEVELARVWGAPRPLGNALIACGLIVGGEGIELLQEATAVLEDSPAALVRARASVELGAALRRANRRADARKPLALGLELAERCGATALIDRAREELIASGARPRRAARTGVDALTATELRVARMASEGMTNRDIAQALFVTPKTVEVHLSHSYHKLGLKSRSQLAGALREPESAVTA